MVAVIALLQARAAGLWSRAHIGNNVQAGIVVGIVALPLAMAFAIASGARPEQGLYTAIVAAFLTSIFGGTRVQISGPTRAFILLTFLLTVFVDLVVAVNVGVILAVLFFMRRMADAVNVEQQVDGVSIPADTRPDHPTAASGTLIYSIDGPMFFGAAEKLERTPAHSASRIDAHVAHGQCALRRFHRHFRHRGDHQRFQTARRARVAGRGASECSLQARAWRLDRPRRARERLDTLDLAVLRAQRLQADAG